MKSLAHPFVGLIGAIHAMLPGGSAGAQGADVIFLTENGYATTTSLELHTSGDDAGACGPGEKGDQQVTPSIDEQTVMFYYEDIREPARFYGETLGLEKTLDSDWVKFFRISPTSYVGVVRAGEGAYHTARPENAVMLSIVTSEVDAWYERLKALEGVVFLKDISENELIRSFLLQDPGGYTVEFFQWQEQP